MPSLFFVSLPASAAPGSMGEPETRLKSWVETQIGAAHNVSSIALPDLKLGLLDNLVQQAEEVAKLDGQMQQVLAKVHESVQTLFGDDTARAEAAEQVDGRPAWAYLQQFGWNTAKYRLDVPIHRLLEALGQEAFSAENDLKTRLASYSQTRQQVQALDRRFSGDLSVRALDQVVRRSDLVQNSEFLVSQLVAVPRKDEDRFLGAYETLSAMVVPRSARKISADEKFVLYSVTVFRKHAPELVHKLKEKQWVPRDSPHEANEAAPSQSQSQSQQTSQQQSQSQSQSGEDDSRQLETDLRAAERRQRKEVEKLAGVTYSDIIKAWGHIKIIRVFVESVLRYGLPTNYVTASFEPKISPEKAEAKLVEQFAFLGGNAISRDSAGRIKEDDLSEWAGQVDQDYLPLVLYVAKLP